MAGVAPETVVIVIVEPVMFVNKPVFPVTVAPETLVVNTPDAPLCVTKLAVTPEIVPLAVKAERVTKPLESIRSRSVVPAPIRTVPLRVVCEPAKDWRDPMIVLLLPPEIDEPASSPM